MKKLLIYISIILFAVSCEDIYKADLNATEDILVIEARITNNVKQNLIRLSKTRNFYSDSSFVNVAGATVKLEDSQGNMYEAIDNGNGFYHMEISAVPLEKYRLIIEFEEENYESDFETMLKVPEIESFDVVLDTTIKYEYNPADNKPDEKKIIGTSSRVDLALKDQASHYLFRKRMVLEYIETAEPNSGLPPTYHWLSVGPDPKFNIAGPADFSDQLVISGHSVEFHQNNIRVYVPFKSESDVEITPAVLDEYYSKFIMEGWILMLDQFGISEKTFEFYKTLNAQLEAEGKLLDPVYPQVQNNIRCVSNPEKVVLGYFELSSHNHTRYFMEALNRNTVGYYEFDEFLVIPDKGELEQEDPPYFWEYFGKPGRDRWNK